MLVACARRFTQVLAVAVLAHFSAQDVALGQEAASGRSFFDDFATFDRKRWLVSNGWASGDFQDCLYLRSQVHHVPGALELRLSETANPRSSFACAEIQSQETYGHGMYEVRMRAAGPAPGFVSAFFTFIRPPHDEIDIEFVGKSPKQIQVNYFVNGASQRGKSFDLDFDTTTSMNDYAFEWLPDSLRWFVNGRLLHEVKRDANTPFPARPPKIFLSIWNAKGSGMDAWLGRFAYPGRPLAVRYEHVAFTEAGQPCQFPTSIICKRQAAPKVQ
jgi:endo-1,3-1,4-beta-glycanase ExoK